LFPKLGACSWNEIENKIPWAQLIQLGYAMGFADVINSTGGFKWIVSKLFLESPVLANLGFMQFMLLWLPTVVFIHIIFAGMNAMVAVLVPIGIALAVALKFDPYITGLLTVMGVSAGAFFMPFNSAPNLVFFSTERFTVLHELKGAIPIAILIVLGFIFALTVWWPMVGIL
jgi:di/tricarboxylate transporter